ncbi:MAG: ATP-binding cassette domain-containing protein, partial [Anaerolineae bacterium]
MGQHIYKTEPLITLDNIALRVYDRIMFQGTSWTIRDDEQWAVVGPNGSGKSTLMRALCGQVPVVQGRVIYRFPGNGRQVVGENLLNPLNLLTKSAQDAIAYVAFEAQSGVLGYEDPYYQMRWNSVKGRRTLTVSEYLSEQHIDKRNPYEVVETH